MNPFKVWFGESLDANNLETAFEESKKADLILVIGTSSQVYPVAMIAPDAADLGIPVIEINLDTTPKTDSFMYHFHGKSGEILPLIVNQMKSDHWFDHFKNSIFQSIQSFFILEWAMRASIRDCRLHVQLQSYSSHRYAW